MEVQQNRFWEKTVGGSLASLYGAVGPLEEPVPVDDRGDEGGQEAHQDDHHKDALADEPRVEPDQRDDHRHLAPRRHPEPDDEGVLPAHPHHPGRKAAPDDFGDDGDDGQHREEEDHIGRECMGVREDPERYEEDRGEDDLEVLGALLDALALPELDAGEGDPGEERADDPR